MFVGQMPQQYYSFHNVAGLPRSKVIFTLQLFLHSKVHATHTHTHRLTHILTQYGKPTDGPGCR